MPWHLGKIVCSNVSEGVAENSSYNSLFPPASLLKGVKYCHCTTGEEELNIRKASNRLLHFQLEILKTSNLVIAVLD